MTRHLPLSSVRFRLINAATGETLARRWGPGLMVAPLAVPAARVVAVDEAGQELASTLVGPMTIYESVDCPAAFALA